MIISIVIYIKYTHRRTRYNNRGAMFDDFEKTALFIAVENENANILQMLIQ